MVKNSIVLDNIGDKLKWYMCPFNWHILIVENIMRNLVIPNEKFVMHFLVDCGRMYIINKRVTTENLAKNWFLDDTNCEKQNAIFLLMYKQPDFNVQCNQIRKWIMDFLQLQVAYCTII